LAFLIRLRIVLLENERVENMREREREMCDEEEEGRRLGIVRGERREIVFILDYNNLLGGNSASQCIGKHCCFPRVII
jgi:hypothetical protein